MRTVRPSLLLILLGCLLLGGCALLDDEPPGEPLPSTIKPAQVPAPRTASPITRQNLSPARIDPSDFAPPTPVRMAFIWYDHPLLQTQDFMETRVQLTSAQGLTQMWFALPVLGIDCNGVMRFDDADARGLISGEFQISCSDSALVSGLIVPVAGQAAINGQGADQFGRSVIFAIQMDG